MDPDPEQPLDVGETPSVTPPSSPPIKCWRCGHSVSPTPSGTCPSCAARIATATQRSVPKPAQRWEESGDASAIRRMLGFYTALLGTTVIFGWIVGDMIPEESTELTKSQSVRILTTMAVVSVIDAAIILFAFFSIRKCIPLPAHTKPAGHAHWWVFALPVLGVLLGINFGYHWGILELAGIEPEEDLLLSYSSLLPLVLVLYCIMPAIFEEIFFRHICLGVVRRYVDTHTAVFVTSMMFGLCHIGVLASAPILAVVGAGFAYVRIYSGSLLLPIALHFLHNLVIVLIDYRWI